MIIIIVVAITLTKQIPLEVEGMKDRISCNNINILLLLLISIINKKRHLLCVIIMMNYYRTSVNYYHNNNHNNNACVIFANVIYRGRAGNHC